MNGLRNCDIIYKCTHTMEFYSVIRKNETTWFEGKWMEFEDILLSEVSQVQKDKGSILLSYVEDISKDKCIHKTNTILYTSTGRICCQKCNYIMELKGGRKGKEKYSQQY
jgi:hypothetical protein